MVGVQGTSDPNPELLDAMAMCGHLVARDSVHWFLAEHRHRLFPDDLFADLFGSGRGRPSVPADVIATVMVLQALEGLSDRDAIAQLRMNIAWKVAAGRPLHDEGFHPTVLTLWRNRLRASGRPQRIFDVVREVIDATNILAGKTRRALDSTVLDDAVTRQDAIMQLVAQIRRVRRLVPAAKALTLVAHDYDNDPGKPACAWNDRADIDRVVTELVNDAGTILAALDGIVLDDCQAEAVEVLADSAYGSGEFRNHLDVNGHTATIKPIPLNTAIPDGFVTDDFTIDLDAMTATCPNGTTVTISSRSRQARFGRRCDGCPLRQRCTRSRHGKVLTVHQHHELLAAARAHAQTAAFTESYQRHRPMVERSIAWLVRRGGRKVRYRGIARNRIGFAHRCAATNLRRLINLGIHWDSNWTITT